MTRHKELLTSRCAVLVHNLNFPLDQLRCEFRALGNNCWTIIFLCFRGRPVRQISRPNSLAFNVRIADQPDREAMRTEPGPEPKQHKIQMLSWRRLAVGKPLSSRFIVPSVPTSRYRVPAQTLSVTAATRCVSGAGRAKLIEMDVR
jgi:hypothetical protein